jgi:hypothetical protein
MSVVPLVTRRLWFVLVILPTIQSTAAIKFRILHRVRFFVEYRTQHHWRLRSTKSAASCMRTPPRFWLLTPDSFTPRSRRDIKGEALG